MASIVGEAVAGKICEMAIEMAVQQLSKQMSLVINFQEDFEWLKNRLRFLKGFLNDANQQCRQKDTVKQWLQDVGDIALRAEDIFELCSVQPLYTSRFLSFSTDNPLAFRYKMARRIKVVKDRINSVIEEGRQLNIAYNVLSREEASSGTFQRAYSKRSSIEAIDSHPVGIEAKVDHLVSLLDNPAVCVIAVVGMGGVGKTFLLQHVYNFTKDRFENSIWLSNSQTFSISKLQHDLAYHLGLRKEIVDGDVTEELAVQLINEKLKGKKCLIVLDDVWKPIKEDNLIERLGLTIGHNCKLVITTRNKDVCRNVRAEIYEMERLSEEDSWELFCIYGFPEYARNRAPENLLDVAHAIAKECGKLPLAIKTTAASLAGITLRREWTSKLRQLKEVSALNKPMEVLKLSYDCLPAHLRACFAYLSFFPEDEKIDCEYLVNLWVAEGFIPDGEDQWDIGWNYLYKLANLCMVEVVEEEKWRYTYAIREVELRKYCIVHDLFLDLAVYISKENKCAFDVENAFTKSPSRKNSVEWCRVLLPKKRIEDVWEASLSPKLLRTLSLYNNRMAEIPSKFLMKMEVLRVLDLSSNELIRTLPDCVGDMKLLKVLNLKDTWLQELPGCVRRLKSLRFLDVSDTFIEKIPVWIGELKCLQHINTLLCLRIYTFPKGISNLTSLRTLRSNDLRLSVKDDDDGELKLEDVGRMIHLQELSIRLVEGSQLQSIEEGILGQLVEMRHLTLEILELPFVPGPALSHPLFPEKLEIMTDLEKLDLRRFSVTRGLCRFVNLRDLRLYECDWSNFPEFQNMPNLVNLHLENSRSCREIRETFGKSGGFPKLRFLLIEDLREVEEFPELEDGAMPRLQVFKLAYII